MIPPVALEHREKKSPYARPRIDDSIGHNNGTTALMQAIIAQEDDEVMALINNGADLNAKDRNNITALRFACASGNDTISLNLISRGADSKTISRHHNFYGFTPLQACVAGGLLPVLLTLLEDPKPSLHEVDQPMALIKLAIKYSQSGSVGVIESHIAMMAINGALLNSVIKAAAPIC